MYDLPYSTPSFTVGYARKTPTELRYDKPTTLLIIRQYFNNSLTHILSLITHNLYLINILFSQHHRTDHRRQKQDGREFKGQVILFKQYLS